MVFRKPVPKAGRSELAPVTREYTIHLRKYLNGRAFKKRAPTAIKTIRSFAEKTMKTTDVRISADLNTALWKRGIQCNMPRIRVRISRKRSAQSGAGASYYSLVEYVPVASYKGLQTTVVEGDDAEEESASESEDSDAESDEE